MSPTVKELPYVDSHSQLQTLDVFTPKLLNESELPPLLVFVHGGAWRSGDKSDLYPLAEQLVNRKDNPCAVALINYRLTTKDSLLHYPVHSQDVLDALEFLVNEKSKALQGLYDSSNLHVAGHSCGAHILSSIFMDATLTSILKPSNKLLQSSQTVSLSEGLYDLDLLLQTFPDYINFIGPVFDSARGTFRTYSPVNWKTRKPAIRWQIIHSSGDSLVDIAQSAAMLNALNAQGAYVIERFDSITGDHDEILTKEQYANMIAEFMFSRDYIQCS